MNAVPADVVVEPPVPTGRAAYLHVTRTATYGFLSALPLLVLYEGMIVLVNQGRIGQVRVGAEVWVKQLLTLVGGAGFLVVGIAVLLVGIGIFMAERKKRIPIRPRYFAWMVLESAFYAVVVAFFVAGLVGAIFALAPAGAGPQVTSESLGLQFVLSIGAGIYEELVFRVLLVGGLFWGFRRVMPRRTQAYVAAAVLGALVFSGVHYVGALGDAFTLASFTFRFFFGLVLNVLFLLRGFGIAAWTHALYDVMVVTHLLG
jgi:membrane protease YdiL (CAAX protease family)